MAEVAPPSSQALSLIFRGDSSRAKRDKGEVARTRPFIRLAQLSLLHSLTLLYALSSRKGTYARVGPRKKAHLPLTSTPLRLAHALFSAPRNYLAIPGPWRPTPCGLACQQFSSLAGFTSLIVRDRRFSASCQFIEFEQGRENISPSHARSPPAISLSRCSCAEMG